MKQITTILLLNLGSFEEFMRRSIMSLFREIKRVNRKQEVTLQKVTGLRHRIGSLKGAVTSQGMV